MESSPKPHWPRIQVSEIVTDAKNQLGEKSLRQSAKDHGIPFETLRNWVVRYDEIDLAPDVVAFFESPAGLVFLHGMMVTLHVEFTKVGSASIRDVVRFLERTGLDSFVAASLGSQQKYSRKIDEQLCAFGETESKRLAIDMPEKLIAVVEDETFHAGKMCLVVIEPVSNYIIMEVYADKRDGETWTRLVKQALENLKVEVVWQSSDEAKGLRKHANVGLGVHHAPDLFHIQQEIVQGTSRALAAIEKQAHQQYQEAMAKTPQPNPDSQLRFEPGPKVKREQTKAREDLEQATLNLQNVREARKGISGTYHPYDPFTSKPHTPESIASNLETHFQTIETAIAHLGKSSHKKVAKAKRLVSSIINTVVCFFCLVETLVEQVTASPVLREQLQTILIPGFYLLEVSRKEKDPERKQKILDKALSLLFPFHQRAGPFADLTDAEYSLLEKTALDCASHFQRSSSCVEGRNAHLARYHRGFHRLSNRRLSALTVIHNFYIRRSDGTTSAERFFGSQHNDLFEWLLGRIKFPARPHNRKKKQRSANVA